ncbi:E-cinnamoyl-CoA:R-phenyllactate CoA transferase [Variibacter gotjawalensis]|uniref:E-cinnamoyl-CoA:R-phenyllactate CoA transferase n=1 Tax=Variibacter gotjawalensis TaxID=1333996 RepID=A0A0S3PT50_9BRAD|nr:CoA transferase [Variibacter gotjawalensis]NIK49456.1 2-methylfumaryl-CoA isomerase [Variibacter gotjawalensis]RZS51308.1 2-methylfumaryl-CoA isomerase [Variibacter gotjawalensis]BAT59141.1 E-cinnamoyl-CoA:R-phenyllactate CoA transferase [Variibacter gotjawalensis]
MYDLLKGLRIVEGSSFIAAPSCGLHLLQLGAEVIRFDNIGGGPDFRRWPLAPNGLSFYWEGLNKGKKSIAIDLTRPEGRELAVTLATAPGKDGGIFLTNFPVGGFLAHDKLAARRADMISVRVMGWADGTTGVDYTVNAAFGYPYLTGPSDQTAPVNHIMPSWDLLTGASAAYSLLAAERYRRETGKGQEVRLPLGDVAMATLSHLGQVAEVLTSGADRPRMGNDIFGAFGRDFLTRDGKRVMVVAITPRQWTGMLKGFGLTEKVAALEAELGVTFAKDEGIRFAHRHRLFPLIEAAIATRTQAECGKLFDESDICWGPYQSVHEAVTEGPHFKNSPLFAEASHPSGHTYPTSGPAPSFLGLDRGAAGSAPKLGQHTDEVLSGVLGLSSGEIGKLHDQKVVAGPEK